MSDGDGRASFASAPAAQDAPGLVWAPSARSGQAPPQPRLEAPARAGTLYPERPLVATRHPRRDYALRRALALTDLGGLAVGYAVVLLALERSSFGIYALWALPTLPVWLVLCKAYGLYEGDVHRISHTTVDDVPHLAHAILVGCLLIWAWFGIAPPAKLLFIDILALGLTALAVIVALRSAVRRGVRRILGPERSLIVGEGDAVALLVRKIRAHPEYALQPVAIVSGSGAGDAGLPGVSLDGGPRGTELAQLIERERIERVIIAHSELDERELLDLVHVCKALSVKVSLLPRVFGAMGPAVQVDDVEGVTMLAINPPVLARSSRLLKRALDVGLSAILLVLLAPLLAAIALAIRLDSHGPALFRQRRVGKAGQSFTLLKFRTMVADAGARRDELLRLSKDPHWLHVDNDPRITRVGRILRHTSLDELPQLWNVLRGDMSLVGPRPLIEAEAREVSGWERSRLDLTPGITGLWQVLGRTNIPFEEMVKLDYLYVTNWSLWTDVRLLLRTLPVVVSRRGVN